MQSVEISGLKEIQKKLEGYPEAMKKARGEFFEEAGRQLLGAVQRRIGGTGRVAGVQDRQRKGLCRRARHGKDRAERLCRRLRHQRAGKRAH